MDTRLLVDGFNFETLEDYNDAKKEAEAVSYIKTKLDWDKPGNVIKIYNNLMDKQRFMTPVGIGFLKALYDAIIQSGIISKENLRPVSVKKIKQTAIKTTEHQNEQSDPILKNQLKSLQVKLKNMRIVTVFLIIVIAIMFGITFLGNNSPLLDAEEKIQNKYASWSQELDEREAAVTLREKALEDLE